MPSDNVSNTDNQQERLEGWIVGFVDGEGCFSVSIIKNSTTKNGWQLFPEFVVTQGIKSINALEAIKKYFGCGNIYVNRRKDNHKENLCRYCVRSVHDLSEKIIPFFQKNQLQTAKQSDFEKFVRIVGMVKEKKHFARSGMKKIAYIIQEMNRKVPARFLKSSETTRQRASNSIR
jgi:hypothetical protein